MSLITKFRSAFLWAVNPLVRWISKQHLPDTHKEVHDEDLEACKKLWRPGDILLSMIEGEGTDLIIAGFWKHAALVVDDNMILQATAPGVEPESNVDFFMTKDAVCLLRPKFATAEQSAAALAWALQQVGKPYDYQMGVDLKAFYCSKLVYDAYKITMGDLCPLKMHPMLEVPVFEPQDFFNDRDNIQILYNSENQDSKVA